MTRIITLLVLGIQTAFGQDSLVRFSQLTYNSEFERKAFANFRNGDLDYLSLLLSTDPGADQKRLDDVRSRIATTKSTLVSSGIEKKKPDKKVKGVYEQVHNTFLKKYELQNSFPEVFSSGNYNCVTATALFALVFQSVDVPYAIKEQPTHVFLVAYPNSSNIMVETTSPRSGYLSFDTRYKETFVNNLRKQKIIGATEAESSNLEALFNKYYFQNEDIDIKKLIGIHYMNDAVFKNDHDNIKEAFRQAEKAYLFYPSHRCQYMIAGLGVEVLSREKLEPVERSVLIGKMSRYRVHGITDEMIKSEFINLTQDVLNRQNNKVLYTKCYTEILKQIDSPELKAEISYLYYYENGRIYYNQGNFNEAKVLFSKALELQPDNVDLGNVFVGALAQTFRNIRQTKPALDTIRLYEKRFPSLLQNNNFNSMLGTAYVAQFGEDYEAGNPRSGEEYRKLFEDFISKNKNINVDSNVIGMAYSNACVYYFKRGQKSRARELLNKGLELAPESYELRMRQQMLSN